MFGIVLLNDQTGSRIDSIEEYCLRNPEKITRKILQEWIEGKGLPVTWESLIQTLRDAGLSVLADQIQASKIPTGGRGGGGEEGRGKSAEHTDQQSHRLSPGRKDEVGRREGGRGGERRDRGKCTTL